MWLFVLCEATQSQAGYNFACCNCFRVTCNCAGLPPFDHAKLVQPLDLSMYAAAPTPYTGCC
jgi:hypothetical protein